MAIMPLEQSTVRLPPSKKKGGGGDAKVILDSNFFTYLRPSTFDKDLFIRGHPTVYSEHEMVQFDVNYQKQLSFNICATRVTRKKTAFCEQWAFLSSHCNIHRDCVGDDLTEFKERQVFISLLILQRMANFRCLPHWCLILSTAMYGWGTRDTIVHATSFLGTTVSRTYRDRFYTSLTIGLVETVIRLLSKELCRLMHNFQHGN